MRTENSHRMEELNKTLNQTVISNQYLSKQVDECKNMLQSAHDEIKRLQLENTAMQTALRMKTHHIESQEAQWQMQIKEKDRLIATMGPQIQDLQNKVHVMLQENAQLNDMIVQKEGQRQQQANNEALILSEIEMVRGSERQAKEAAA